LRGLKEYWSNELADIKDLQLTQAQMAMAKELVAYTEGKE